MENASDRREASLILLTEIDDLVAFPRLMICV